MSPDPDELHRIGESLDDVVRSLKGGSTARAVAGVFAEWAELVGPQIAAHAKPVSLVEGRLLVEVDEPGWATQLRYLEAEILGRLAPAAGVGAPTSMEVRVRRH